MMNVVRPLVARAMAILQLPFESRHRGHEVASSKRNNMIAMARATKGRTTFIIAHRLATVRNTNRIFAASSAAVRTGQL